MLSKKMERILNVIHPAGSTTQTDACEDSDKGQDKESDCHDLKDNSSLATIRPNPEIIQVSPGLHAAANGSTSYSSLNTGTVLHSEQQPCTVSVNIGWATGLEDETSCAADVGYNRNIPNIQPHRRCSYESA